MQGLLQTLNFLAPTVDDFDALKKAISPFAKGSMSCEITPLTLLIWEKYYHQKIAFFDDMLFVRLGEGQNIIYLLPFAKDMKKAVEILKKQALYDNIPLAFLAAEGVRLDEFNLLFGEEFSQTESRDDFEYLYSTQKLSTLSGKAFHSKRNHISAFSKQYNWHYEAINSTNLADVLKMADEWTAEMSALSDDAKSIEVENAALKALLPQMDRLGLKGGCIKINDRVVAFSVGSPINDEVFDIHTEKALTEYRTAYAVINREFILNDLLDYKYVNREDDMGIEGLRKAKLSYKPDILLKKYIIKEG